MAKLTTQGFSEIQEVKALSPFLWGSEKVIQCGGFYVNIL